MHGIIFLYNFTIRETEGGQLTRVKSSADFPYGMPAADLSTGPFAPTGVPTGVSSHELLPHTSFSVVCDQVSAVA